MIVNLGDWDKAKDKNVMLIVAISTSYPDESNLHSKNKLRELS